MAAQSSNSETAIESAREASAIHLALSPFGLKVRFGFCFGTLPPLFFGSLGRVERLERSSDLRAGPAARFRNILNFECQAHRSKMLWLMWSKRKPGEREGPM